MKGRLRHLVQVQAAFWFQFQFEFQFSIWNRNDDLAIFGKFNDEVRLIELHMLVLALNINRFYFTIIPDADGRLPRGRSLLIIAVLSALSWVVVIALFLALRAILYSR